MKGQENFKKTAALSLIIAFGMTPATGVLADSTGDASNDITSEYTAEQSDALEVMTFASVADEPAANEPAANESVADEFVIENGVLKKYNGTAANVVPGYAEASMYVRSYSRTELDGVVARVKKVLQGAAMMTETEVEIIEEKSLDNKIPVLSLNELVMEQAEKVKAPCIRPARQKTGSTDFGNVMRHVPGTCIRVAFVPEGAAAHSQEYLDACKT